jgi:hypothetical protein
MLSDPSNRPRLSLSSPKASWVPWGAVCQGYRSKHLVRQNGWVHLKKPDMNGYLWLKSTEVHVLCSSCTPKGGGNLSTQPAIRCPMIGGLLQVNHQAPSAQGLTAGTDHNGD